MPFSLNRFLPRLRAAGRTSEIRHTERVLAVARVILALGALAALALDPFEPVHQAFLFYLLASLYLGYSACILVRTRFRFRPGTRFQFWLQVVDVFWPFLLSFFLSGTGNALFLFYVFVLLEAAYRWGLKETALTSVAMVGLLLARDFLAGVGPLALISGPMDNPLLNFLMRAPYLLVLGYLTGYLGEREKLPHWMAVVTLRTLGELQTETTLRGVIREKLRAMCKLAGASRAMIVMTEAATGRAFLWDSQSDSKGEEKSPPDSFELDASERERYLFDVPGDAWHVLRSPQARDHAEPYNLVALNDGGERLHQVSWQLPQALLAAHPFRSLLGVSTAYGEGWTGTVLLFDPNLGSGRQMALRFFQSFCRQVDPVIFSRYVSGRLRLHAGAVERARVARELHDGVIQSLISLEMQMDVLRRRSEVQGTPCESELGAIQSLLRSEVVSLRELMQQMRPLDLGPKQLLEFLAYTVEKFRRDTNINANFISSLKDVHLSPRFCSELGRIIQEALVNVRRHSGAQHVVVRFESAPSGWKLIVDDDGRGFDFVGRLTHHDLDDMRKGPLVIKERVRDIGGELTIYSLPGRGARLEVTVPHTAHER